MYPIIPINVYNFILVSWISAVIRITTIAGTKEGTESTVGGIGDHFFITVHIAELGTTAELIYTTVRYYGIYISFCNMSGIDATSIKLINVGIVYLPYDVTVSMVGCRTNTLHTSSRHFSEATSIDVTLSIIIIIIFGCVIVTGQVKDIIISTCYRDWRMGRICVVFNPILMLSNMEFFKPDITSHMIILHSISFVVTLRICHPLLNNTALQDYRAICPAFPVVL